MFPPLLHSLAPLSSSREQVRSSSAICVAPLLEFSDVIMIMMIDGVEYEPRS